MGNVTILDIKAKVKELRASVERPSNSLEKTIILKYKEHVLTKLNRLFEKQEFILDANSKNALLSLKNHCELPEEKWNEFLAKCSDDNATLLSNLKNFLVNNCKNFSSFYTALPDDEITKLIYNVATYVVEQQKELGEEVSIIEVLMPTVNTKSIKESYSNLSSRQHNPNDDKLKNVLKTHILGQKARYLVPVELLTELKSSELSKPQKIENPYFDPDQHPEAMRYLTDDELQRLWEHSPTTDAVFDAANYINIYASDKSIFSFCFKEWLKLLPYHVTKIILAKESKRTTRTVFGIHDYHDVLADNLSDFYPLPPIGCLRDSLCAWEDIINIYAGAQKNNLESYFKEYPKLDLGDGKNEFIDEAKKQFEEAKQQLKKQLENHAYSNGHDKLFLNLEILKKLKVKFEISKFTDLVFLFNALSLEEINTLIVDNQLRLENIQSFKKIEELALFCMETTPKKLTLFLDILKDKLCLWFKEPDFRNQFFTLAAILDVKKCNLFLNTFRGKIVDFFGNANTCGSESSSMIGKNSRINLPSSFGKLFQSLSSKHHSIFYDVLKEVELPAFVLSSTRQFNSIFESLTPKEAKELYFMVSGELINIIQKNDLNSFLNIIKPLSHKLSRDFCETNSSDLAALLPSGKAINKLRSRVLENYQLAEICHALVKRCPENFSLDVIFKHLPVDDRKFQKNICEALGKERLKEIIKTGKDKQTLKKYCPTFYISLCQHTIFSDKPEETVTTASTQSDFTKVYK